MTIPKATKQQNEKSEALACLKNLQTLTNAVKDKRDAELMLQHLAGNINRETMQLHGTEASRQTYLNLCYRSYFQLLRKFELDDVHQLGNVIEQQEAEKSNSNVFQRLYAILLTDYTHRLQAEQVKQMCLKALKQALAENSNNILAILKSLNLLCKKFPLLSMEQEVSLDCIYGCLQCSACGMREESLVLFTNCCQTSKQAFEYFQVIVEFLPWTNRNKFYLLSCILSKHSLIKLLQASEHSSQDFFAGVRMSLSYKSLLAASQYLVKALSNQESSEFQNVCADILTNGTTKEVENFHSQWFSRIKQKESLYELLQEQPKVIAFLHQTHSLHESSESVRIISIFRMFSRQIFESKLQFFKISTELITNCSKFDNDAQLHVFKFVIDNISCFAIEDCLNFVLSFIKAHKSVETAQYRNGMLTKIPTIINHTAKNLSKLQTSGCDCSTLESSIIFFFQQLQEIIDTDVQSAVYQLKIFALKLLELLLKSLYAQNIQKNAKNCSILQNQKLGLFLIERKVFNAQSMTAKLLCQLEDAQGYDDALELIVLLLELLNKTDVTAVRAICIDYCQRSDVDECALATHFAQAAVQGFETDKQFTEFFEFIFHALTATQLPTFRQDPLYSCKYKGHIFGHLNVMNVILAAPQASLNTIESLTSLLELLANILNIILNMLNLCNVRSDSNFLAASFQDMDESLELLVTESEFKTDNHQECRKYLLMSFWLTLKACCDLATTVGCILASLKNASEENLVVIKECLNINVAVLTRCRHKGAIESAGLSIGKLTNSVTSNLHHDEKAYKLLYDCIELLFDDGKQVSTTRRGAGFSIMFLHVIKNEAAEGRALFKFALRKIFEHLPAPTMGEIKSDIIAHNCDHMEALTLHYLCVLVKDTEMRDIMIKYYNEIMLAAIVQIDNSEWTICNAALQLFGALIPKIVGQKQATELDTPVEFEPCEVTYNEIIRKLPKACEYILNYCNTKCQSSAATRSIILFLGFLSKVEHINTSSSCCVDNSDTFLASIRIIMWRLVRHNCEKVRKLAALCFVRAHDFRYELPQALLAMSKLLFAVQDENCFQGFIFTLTEGIFKMQYESKYTLSSAAYDNFMQALQLNLANTFTVNDTFKLYTYCKLIDLILIVGFDKQSVVVKQLLQLEAKSNTIGYDDWLARIQNITNNTN